MKKVIRAAVKLAHLVVSYRYPGPERDADAAVLFLEAKLAERKIRKSPFFSAPYGEKPTEYETGDIVTISKKNSEPFDATISHKIAPGVWQCVTKELEAPVVAFDREIAMKDPYRMFLTRNRHRTGGYVPRTFRPMPSPPAPQTPTGRLVFTETCKVPPHVFEPPVGRSDAYRTIAEQVHADAQRLVSQFRRDYPEIVEAWHEEQERLTIAAAGAAMVHDPCYTVQYGDLTVCKTCDLRWDTNDQCPPTCPYTN